MPTIDLLRIVLVLPVHRMVRSRLVRRRYLPSLGPVGGRQGVPSPHNIRVMELEIRHLRVICTVAETGSIGRAAAALRVSQPSLSAQLHRIERMLGGTLFVRRNHGVATTSFGEMVLTRCRAVLPTIDELSRATSRVTLDALGADPRLLRLGSVNAPLLVRPRHRPARAVSERHHHHARRRVADPAGRTWSPAACWNSPSPARTRCTSYRCGPKSTTTPWPPSRCSSCSPTDHPLAEPTRDRPGRPGRRGLRTAPPRRRPHPRVLRAGLPGGRLRDACAARHRGHPAARPDPGRSRGRRSVRRRIRTARASPSVPSSATPLWYRHVLIWHRSGPFRAHAGAIKAIAAAAYEEATRRNTAYCTWLASHARP